MPSNTRGGGAVSDVWGPILSAIGSGILTAAGLLWKLSARLESFATKAEVKSDIDELQEHVDETFVTKELYNEFKANTAQSFNEVRQDIREARTEIIREIREHR